MGLHMSKPKAEASYMAWCPISNNKSACTVHSASTPQAHRKPPIAASPQPPQQLPSYSVPRLQTLS